jgi:hypothetical protein
MRLLESVQFDRVLVYERMKPEKLYNEEKCDINRFGDA